ncbi:MAG: hypothetical protein ACX94C_14485 [Phycisphaerales bacterium]
MITERLKRGEPAVSGLLSATDDLDAEHEAERAFQALLGPPRAMDREAWAGAGPCMPPPGSEVIDGLIVTLMPIVEGAPWEAVFWRYVLPSIPCVIPSRLVGDLIARDIEVVLLGHFPLRDADLWKLVDVDEALLTLAVRRYANPEYDCGAFEEVLHAAPEHGWVLRTLIAHTPSDAEKQRELARYIEQSPERESLLERACVGLRAEIDTLNS